MIYLDHNATTPLKPAVAATMAEVMAVYGNPSSTHQAGQKARFLVDDARRHVGEAFGLRPEQVVFTSGGSEANNLCLRGYFAQNPRKTLVISSVEHSCVHQTALALHEDYGVDIHLLCVNKNGTLDMAELEEVCTKKDVGLVSVMHANNETGVLHPIAPLAGIAKKHGAFFHVDAVQTAGKIPLAVADLGADMFTLSFHKMGGPKGIGAVLFAKEVPLCAHISGGTQERGRRAGTENTLAIAGAGACAKLVEKSVEHMAQHVTSLREKYERLLQEKLPHVALVGQGVARTPNTMMLILRKADGSLIDGQTASMQLDLAGYAVSTGSACSSGRITPSRVLLAMGYSLPEAQGAIRVSLGEDTTDDAMAGFTEALVRICS